MKQLLLIAIGGAAGALSRYWLSAAVMALASRSNLAFFPYGTLLVNVIGSLMMGVFYVLIVDKALLPADLKSVAMVGFLGAFTTFSTFSLEAVNLFENGQPLAAFIYIVASVVICILAAALAVSLTRLIVI